MQYPGEGENKRHGLSYAAKKVQGIAHDVIEQLDIAMAALSDIKENGKGKTKACEALCKIKAIDLRAYGDSKATASEGAV